MFCTWSCDFRCLDEFVVWKVLNDLLGDFPRVDLHSFGFQHLQCHEPESDPLKMTEMTQKYTNFSYFHPRKELLLRCRSLRQKRTVTNKHSCQSQNNLIPLRRGKAKTEPPERSSTYYRDRNESFQTLQPFL